VILLIKSGMRLTSCAILILLNVGFGQLTDPPTGPLRPVAEFERSQGVLIAYPFGIPASFIADMSQDLIIYCLVASSLVSSATNAMSAAGVNMDAVEFILGQVDTFWTQDYGPYFVVDGNDEMVIVDFEYNRPRPYDNQAPNKMSNHLDVPYYDSDVVHNGGNLMFDGYSGAAASTLVFSENIGLDVEDYMLDYYGIVNHYSTDDPTDNFHQHINCWAKFLSPERIMIIEVPGSHWHYDDVEDVVAYFESQLNCFGEPFKISRVYTPGNEPYVNSLILNEKIYVPTSNGQWDDEAIVSFEEAMPGYEVIGIDYWDWYNDDALHCRTQAIPDIEMLQILHNPIDDQMFPLETYQVEVSIIDLSSTGVIADSTSLFWKNSDMDEYLSITMTATDLDYQYEGFLPVQLMDTQVSYFITASDSSGRNERLPIAGSYNFFAVGGYPLELGDVNLDGSLNVLDIITMVNHILNIDLLSGYPLYLADVNSDSIVNIFDIIVLLNIIVSQ